MCKNIFLRIYILYERESLVKIPLSVSRQEVAINIIAVKIN